MQESLQTILNIQDLDIKMIRLMKVKKEQEKELIKVNSLKNDIRHKVANKEAELSSLKEQIRLGEIQIKDIEDKITKLETQQASVKKMDEFNALTQEMSNAGKERRALEHRLSDLMDKVAGEEDLIVSLKENLASTEESSSSIEIDIQENIQKINEEGRSLLTQRENLVTTVDVQLFKNYERLIKNKKDKVVVPIENRVCSGCHIMLTPQHENLVRKQERLIFCEHCSRILYWKDHLQETSSEHAPKKRRRKASL